MSQNVSFILAGSNLLSEGTAHCLTHYRLVDNLLL